MIVDWSFPNLNFGQNLYYSANGLQMLSKKLNYRESYELHTNQTYSSNYYPITSALVAKDANSDLQITVMNDRSQGGSVGLRNNNSIELMQHRRLLIDDSKGMQEPLDEKDSDGRGIRVKAKYWMQIHRTSKTPSKQRHQQMLIDKPLIIYYSKSHEFIKGFKKPKTPDFKQTVQTNITGAPLKTLVFPK